MGINVRALLTADRDAVEAILTACAAFTAEEVRVALELIDDALVRGAQSDYVAFVAARDGKVCGYVCLGKTPLTQSTWYLYWICVDERLQRSGIGSELQSHAEAFVLGEGGRRLLLETSSQPQYERARRFYEGRGYQPIGRVRDFYKAGDDCIIYCRELTSA